MQSLLKTAMFLWIASAAQTRLDEGLTLKRRCTLKYYIVVDICKRNPHGAATNFVFENTDED
jgi:hypothetical protein